MQPKFEQHPLSAAFPSMPGHEVDALAADIRAHGQREPITLFEGQVLDGWHRARACEIAGIEPTTTSFLADGDPVAFVKSRNLHRRHLTESQRAQAIVRCSEWRPAGKPAPGPGSVAPGETAGNAEMAAEADVGERTIRRAKVAERAGLGDAVLDGKVSVKRAAEIVKDTPGIAKKIAAGKITADQVIEKAAKAKVAEKLPKILPRPEPVAKPSPVAVVKCKVCEQSQKKIDEYVARVCELEEQLEQQDHHLEGLLKQIEGPDAAAKEIKALKGQLRTVGQTRDAEMAKNAELIAEVKRLQRKVTKLEGKAKAA